MPSVSNVLGGLIGDFCGYLNLGIFNKSPARSVPVVALNGAVSKKRLLQALGKTPTRIIITVNRNPTVWITRTSNPHDWIWLVVEESCNEFQVARLAPSNAKNILYNRARCNIKVVAWSSISVWVGRNKHRCFQTKEEALEYVGW